MEYEGSKPFLYNVLENRLNRIADSAYTGLLYGGLKGIEKESLRITRDGRIAQTPHPPALGSALTHPYITTDYSEALLELITPPFAEIKDTLQFLHRIHQFVYANIEDELLWATSMPCALEGERSIPIARYGSSNVGMMKHIYRVGLAYRYGRAMQAIAGVHFNYSFPNRFWPIFQELEGNDRDRQEFISHSYFCLIRNFQRMGWLIPYLFGCSPAVCRSFLSLRARTMSEFDAKTQYEPYATSLRMSDIGYKNKTQSELSVSYDNLDAYVASLTRAIKTQHPEYQKIGVKVNEHYRQLNANILQIENEYYSFVRPKQIAYSGEKPVLALKRRGIEYIEIRALDLCAFDPMGVNLQQLRFLETFVIFCMLHESPPLSRGECDEIEFNQRTVAVRGREPEIALQRNRQPYALREWATEICNAMEGVCEYLDQGAIGRNYLIALDTQREKIRDPTLLPSTRMLLEMRRSNRSFFRFALDKSEEHERDTKSLPMATSHVEYFRDLSRQSLEQQRAMEATAEVPFADYLDQYFAQK